MPRMRLPNGYGQIAKLKSKRLRNPYRVRVVSERDPISRLPVRYATLGYYRTYTEAQAALAQYHDKPHLIVKPKLFSEVFEEWRSRAFSEQEYSKRTFGSYIFAYKHASLKSFYINEIRASHIRDNLADPKLPVSAPRLLLLLYQQVFKYAVQEGIVEVNVAKQVSLPKVSRVRAQEAKKPKSAFSRDDLEKIAALVGDRTADAVLYSCFSGWRPSEMLALSEASVNLPMQYVNGGSKTEAGKDRAVPIHPQIKDILIKKKGQRLFGFNSYRTYLDAFNALMQKLGIEGHTPHDTRRTFVTLAKAAGVDEYALKKIVGHSISDLTEAVYTDRPLSWLINEMNKIPLLTPYKPHRAIL